VNIEQNKIIKIFTIVSVIFMPPTLIASIYGMNFEIMPELDKKWGVPDRAHIDGVLLALYPLVLQKAKVVIVGLFEHIVHLR